MAVGDSDVLNPPAESEEIAPLWAPIAAPPFPRMWDDGQYWLPGALRGAPARWLFVYGRDNARVQLARRVAGPCAS